MAQGFWARLVRRMPLILAGATVVALLGAMLVRGESSLGFVAAFVVLLPLTLASALIRWWPGGRAARTACRQERVRRALWMLAVALMISAVITLVAGVAWSGSRVGNMLMVAGILLLPPAVVISLLGFLGRRSIELRDEVGADAHVELETNAHWAVFLPALVVLGVTALLAIGPFGVWGQGAAAVLYLVVLPGLAIRALASFVNSEAVLTDRYLHVASGLLWQRVVRFELRRVGDIGVRQHWLGRWLGFGKVTVVDADGHAKVVPGLRDPAGLVQRTRARL
ncbi:PH domain-containing protein [Thioalkalivibrio sp. ALJ24]|uniref:PH domain-containing protein n=1 Tax=Thioalkalivibrio sp. ALJ24 TaxID=545276 RepID=UPI000375C1D9|nr:PH domain-containing protein [Thioalkalivibrio sp. ALJ24]